MSDRPLSERIFSWAKLLAFLALIAYIAVDALAPSPVPRIADATPEEKQARFDYCTGAQSILGKVNRFLRCMEVSSFRIAGIEAKVAQEREDLQDSTDAVAEAVSLIDEALAQLSQPGPLGPPSSPPSPTRGPGPGSGAVTTRSDVVQSLQEARDYSVSALAKGEATLQSIDDFQMRRAPASAARVAEASAEWVLVAGADKDLGPAKAQADSVQRVTGKAPILVKRGTFFRTVIVYRNRDQAQAAFNRYQTLLQHGALIRGYDDFCPKPRETRADRLRSGPVRYLVCNGS